MTIPTIKHVPLKDQLFKAKMSYQHKRQVFELLDYMKDMDSIKLEKAKDNDWVTALCWLQFNGYAQITMINQVNGTGKNEIIYGLTVGKDEIPKMPV